MPRIVDKQQKEKQILQAALTVFAQKGFNGTKMIDIADQAGVGKGTLYEYFSSKEDIFFKTFFYLFEQYDNVFQQKLKSASGPVEKIKLVVQTYFIDFSEKNFDLMPILTDFWLASARENQTQNFSLLALYQKYRQLLSQILQEGIDLKIFRTHNTEHYASILLGLLDGLFLQLFLDRHAFEIKSMAESICQLFLTSLLIKNEEN